MPAVIEKKRVCLHCGTPFRATVQEAEFCCSGCRFVHDLIVQGGLGQFYDLQDAAVPPAPATVFAPRDYAWLTELARITPDSPLTLDLQGLSCVGCVWLIERLFQRREGALTIRLDSNLGRLTLRTTGSFDHAAFARELQSFGYLVGPPVSGGKTADRSLGVRLGLCGALALNAMLFTVPAYLGMAPGEDFAALFATLAFVCGTLSFLIGGSYFIRRAWQGLRIGVLHIDLPIALGLVAAWSASILAWRMQQPGFVYFDFVSTFTFLMLVGRWVQQKAVDSNRSRLLTAGPDLLHPAAGERYELAPGATVPVRSMLHGGEASLSFEWINGEPDAHAARAGEVIAAGAINLTARPIECEALEPWEESFLAQIVGQTSSAPARDDRLQRFLRLYLVAVLALAAGAFAGWAFGTGDLLRALQVCTSILVVSCPCALGVALPLVDDLAAARVQRLGVFIREGSLWGRLRRIKQIVFDKTGTLTLQGAFLTRPDALDDLEEPERRVLFSLVRENLHPIASALREALMARGTLPVSLDTQPREHVGSGLEASHGGSRWRIGRPQWAAGGVGSNRCVFTRDGEVLAGFDFTESLRADTADTLADFNARGLGIFILSGDRAGKVSKLIHDLAPIAAVDGLGDLRPEEKAAWLRAHDGDRSLMIGDGANDSLAFRESLCTGTPAIDRGLLEKQADFYFLGRSLAGLRTLLDTARRRAGTVRAIVAFAIAYNIVTVALSAAGHMTPIAAAILMPLSSLVTLALAVGALGMDRRIQVRQG